MPSVYHKCHRDTVRRASDARVAGRVCVRTVYHLLYTAHSSDKVIFTQNSVWYKVRNRESHFGPNALRGGSILDSHFNAMWPSVQVTIS